jgi:diguanylate cyclase (GGDEF)-like protein
MDSRGRVLIVDDERFNINVLIDLLEPDFETMVAMNGEQALKRAKSSTPPDLILLDIMMPAIDGYEVCRILKANEATNDIPIIFITAMDKVGDEEKGLALGAIDYITKPISPSLVKLRVGNHIKLKQQSDLLRDLATFDGLTGIPNRRRFDLSLEREWQYSIHNGSPLTLILMDIDYFKPYNDNYGHTSGDDCLRKVAKSLTGAINRNIDLVARYGGEEFVCLLPNTNGQNSEITGEKLRNAVADLRIPHEYSKAAPYITISLGAATMTPGSEDSSLVLIENADRNLYGAKEQGRNRLVR